MRSKICKRVDGTNARIKYMGQGKQQKEILRQGRFTTSTLILYPRKNENQ